MSLPKVTINYLNGMLGTVPESEDGLLALVCPGSATDSFNQHTPVKIQSLSDLKEYGIKDNEGGNTKLYRSVQSFYQEAPEGTPLVIYAYKNNDQELKDLCDEEKGSVLRDLLITMKGRLRGVIIGTHSSLHIDNKMITNAQSFAEWATTKLYAPIFVFFEEPAKSGLKIDLSECGSNRVGVFTGSDLNPGAIGTLAGRIASIPVQRNIGRVKDGPLAPVKLYIGEYLVEDATREIEKLYGNRYITTRTYVGKSGYFFTDDCLACKTEDDYHSLALRRVADKAYRIAYSVMLEELLDEIYVNEDGTMQPVIIKSLQARLEDAINKQMTAKGELSADASNGESGCICYINEKQDVLTTSTINMELKIRPFAYARYININLGFQVKSSND